MRVMITGGEADEAARIACALAASGFEIAEGDAPVDLVLTVGPALPERLQLGELAVDLTRRRVQRRGQPIWLTPAEFGLLAFLIRARRAVTRDELLRELWGLDFDPQTNSVAVHVSRIRRKLGRDVIATRPDGYAIARS